MTAFGIVLVSFLVIGQLVSAAPVPLGVEKANDYLVEELKNVYSDNNGDFSQRKLHKAIKALSEYDESKCSPLKFGQMNRLKSEMSTKQPILVEYIDYHLSKQVQVCETKFVSLVHEGLAKMANDEMAPLAKLDELRKQIEQVTMPVSLSSKLNVASARDYLLTNKLANPLLAAGLAKYHQTQGQTSVKAPKVGTAMQKAAKGQFDKTLEIVKKHLSPAIMLREQMAKAAPLAFKGYSDEAANWAINLLIAKKLDRQSQVVAAKKSSFNRLSGKLSNLLTSKSGRSKQKA